MCALPIWLRRWPGYHLGRAQDAILPHNQTDPLLSVIVFSNEDTARSPVILAFPLFAQPRPVRDANQPVDEEYTKKIREYTTEPFFNSPLTDYQIGRAP